MVQMAPKPHAKIAVSIDYFISSTECIRYICDFQVNEFSSLYSDAHCGVAISLTARDVLGTQRLDNEMTTPEPTDSGTEIKETVISKI